MKWIKGIFLFLILGLCLFGFTRNKGAQSWDCPFCAPQMDQPRLLYRGDVASLVLTHKPSTPGHTLIIPNRHVERFELLSEEEVLEMRKLVQRVQKATQKVYGTREYALVQKNGAGVGQSVPHVHLHFIPKKEETSQAMYIIRFFVRPWLAPISTEEMKVYAAEILSEFQSEDQQDSLL